MYFDVSPLRGLITASYPSGSSIANPKGINALQPGGITIQSMLKLILA